MSNLTLLQVKAIAYSSLSWENTLHSYGKFYLDENYFFASHGQNATLLLSLLHFRPHILGF